VSWNLHDDMMQYWQIFTGCNDLHSSLSRSPEITRLDRPFFTHISSSYGPV